MARLPTRDLDHILSHTEALWEDLHHQSIFLTGGTGFVGTWLLESLLWANDKLDLHATVVVLTRHPERFRDKSAHLAGHPAVQLLGGNVVGFDYPGGRRFPFVIHAATEHSFEANGDRPLGTFSSDVDGTQRVLEFARSHGTRRLLFTGSGAVYGKQPSEMCISEDCGSAVDRRYGSAYGQRSVYRVHERSTAHLRFYSPAAARVRDPASIGPNYALWAISSVMYSVRPGPGRWRRDAMPVVPVRRGFNDLALDDSVTRQGRYP